MKSKKFLVQLVLLMMSFVLIFSTTACRTPEPPPAEEPAEEEPVVVEPEEKPYKIGIMTGTVSQGEEEYQEAMNQIAKYGDMIVHATYPDNFSTETETTISQVVQMASDPEVKAIVFVQAIPGAAAAIEKVRETRPDMLFVAGVPAEDPPIIAEKADIVLQVDEISMGRTIPELAAKMGAKTFIHYSFPRHLSYATIARRLEIMKETCAELGIELVEVNAPDPTGDAGVSGAQQFITEDVPRQIATYGKDTAFFSTNCAMQEPLIRTIWENGAIYPQQCCPSPYHGYPAGLNIDVSGHEGDVQYMLDQIAIKLKEKGQEGRMSTWGVPINMLMIDAGVRYAIKFAEGEVTDPKDTEAFIATLNEASAARGLGNLTVTNFNEDGINLPNFLMLLAPFYDFSQNTAAAVVEEVEPYKIGIMTGTVSQGEEEYQEAMNQIAKYGDMIVHATYPDNFSTETETTISQVVQMASDPEVKAIVFVQAIPGAAAAIEKVRETRPDMLFVAGVPAEDPPIIAEKADIVLQVDEISMGRTIPELAAKMGAKTFIHYSFPRHLSYATIARRLEIMKETCAELGIELVEVNAPDPTGDAGVSGAQQFITEDVPRQIATYGKDTAFFSTNCAMQEPLIRTIWENGAIYPQQCCPSPYHGYPAGLNIDVSGHEGDVQYMLDQIAIKLKEKGQEGRMSTWGVPINMLMIDAGVRYAIKFAEGEVTDPKDTEAFIATLNEASAARGLGNLTVTNFNEDGINLPNFLMLLAPFYDFSQNTAAAVVEEVEPYKIGIMTGTVSQGEEEYQEAMNQIAKYGDMIVHATYPDNFSTETETTISQVVQMASDPEVKAIVFVQAIPGAAAAIEKVRETRPDMLFVAGVPAEDPPIIAEKADIVLQVDEISMGRTIPELAAKMGAKTFIHYSFPRHLSYATIARRLEIMKETCAELGIELVEVNAPDPTGDAGVSGAQQFITEDVPRQIATYGKDTAFFSTNCAMQEPLIRTIWENGAIYPQQCCPSPYHGYPAGLNIDVSGHEGDVQYMLDQIAIKLKEKGQEGRMSTWGVPINMLMIDAGVRYAIKFAEGEVTDPRDVEAFKQALNEAAAARNVGDITVTSYNEDGVDLPNFLMLLAPFYDFSQ